MRNGLNKKQIEEHQAIAGRMQDCYDAAESAWAAYVQAIEKLNQAISEAADFRDTIVQEMADYASDRGEKWADSDAGQAFEAWQGAWELVDLEQIDVSETNDDLSQLDADGFAELPHNRNEA
jgi:hypothetical protein